MGRRSVALGRKRAENKKPSTAAAFRLVTASDCYFLPALVSLISSQTTDEQFLSWGWRIPFLFSIVLVLGALWMRNRMDESAEFEQQQQAPQPEKKRLPVVEALIRHPWAF